MIGFIMEVRKVKVKSLGKGLISLFFPANCKICHCSLEPLNRSFICEDCWSKVKWLEPPYCSKCSKPFPSSSPLQEASHLLCPECGKEKSYFEKIFVPTLYEGVMKEAIHLLKYKRKRRLMVPLEKIMKRYFDHIALPYLDLVVPIPLHRKRFRERGFNQAELIADIVARYFRLKLVKNNLQRVKATKTQTTLSKKERIKNIKGAFQVKNKGEFQKKSLLLVDDVYTTGTTLKEAARVLKGVEAREIYLFTLARAS